VGENAVRRAVAEINGLLDGLAGNVERSVGEEVPCAPVDLLAMSSAVALAVAVQPGKRCEVVAPRLRGVGGLLLWTVKDGLGVAHFTPTCS